MKRKYIICGTFEKLIPDKLIFRGLKLVENIEMLLSPRSFINDKCTPGTSGIRITKYPTGQLWISESYNSGKLDGERKVWSLDGSLWRHEFYKNGKLDGELKEWAHNRLSIHAFYQNGKPHGERKCWHESSDKLSVQEFWKNGIREGERKTWYSNGQLRKESSYQNGRLEGKCEEWYSSGQMFRLEFYRNGALEREQKYWHENGQLSRHSVFQNGEWIHKDWYDNGQRMRSSIYRNNKLEGKYNYWLLSGKLFEQAFYRNGNKIGECKQYDNNGEIRRHLYFDMDFTYQFSSRKKLVFSRLKNKFYSRMMRKRLFHTDNTIISDLMRPISQYL